MSIQRDPLGSDRTDELLPLGVHVCLLYEDEAERRSFIQRFVQDGLTRGEKVLYLTDVMTPQEVRDWLGDMGVDQAEDTVADHLEVAEARSVYYPTGEFVPERVFAFWENLDEDVRRTGHPGARATGETSWAVRGIPGAERLLEYEAGLTRVLQKTSVSAICQYDVHLFDGRTILDILRVHPVIVSRGQLVQNPFYVGPDDFMGRQGEA